MEGAELERALEAEQVKRLELEAIEAVDLTLSYSEVERGVIEAETGACRHQCLPWVVEGQAACPLARRSGLAFLGSYNHPNRDAIRAFLSELWPPAS